MPEQPHPFFFIVGNSRSGTTMVMRMLGNHSQIHALSEWHFFEQLWSSADTEKTIVKDKAIILAARLLKIQRKGYQAEFRLEDYKEEASEIIGSLKRDTIYPIEVFKATAFHETVLSKKVYPCEKTPQNVFYIEEILEMLPGAKIINLIRDPRGVMLSQKRKANRRRLGANWINRKEALRLKTNYHPITTSRLWNSAILASQKFADHPKVYTAYFENILTKPKLEMEGICSFLGLTYNHEMLQIQHLGSSNEPDDPNQIGIKAERAAFWQDGGLNQAEVQLCQKISGSLMKKHGYQLVKTNPNHLTLVGYYFSFPLKLALALILNLHRMKNISETIRKRLN
ncbi:MAG: sulfotransferase [Saprospiraceae bacterium]|nr:sulfotransferase [Saprospiraceae bacterium]